MCTSGGSNYSPSDVKLSRKSKDRQTPSILGMFLCVSQYLCGTAALGVCVHVDAKSGVYLGPTHCSPT